MTLFEITKLGGYLVSPLTVAMGLFLLAGLCLAWGRTRWGMGLGSVALVGLWLASTPLVATALIDSLERRYPAITVEKTPVADAIVVLGGALAGASPPKRPGFNLGPSAGRVWHAATLFRAGKARWIIVAAGNQPGLEGEQVEAEAVAEMLQVLGVPKQAIRLETGSRNTRENALHARPIIERLGVHRVLLVTSGMHMPRAMTIFTKAWADSNIELVPAPTDIAIAQRHPLSVEDCFPNAGALLTVTRALKEFAGTLAYAIMG